MKFLSPEVALYLFLLILIHTKQGETATARHGITRKRSTKRLKHTWSGLLIFAIDVKMDRSAFEEKSSFKML